MSGGGQNTVTQQTIPSQILPYYQSALQSGQNLFGTGGPQYYPGATVAPFNPAQEQGMSDTMNIAGSPSPTMGAAGANMFETSGALLNPSMNPYLQGTFHQAANSVQNQLASEFAGNGSNVINSLPVQSDAMNNLATQLYGGAYQQGLQNMTQASALAPGIAQGMYLPAQEELNVGNAVQNQAQNLINANQNAWNYNQQNPYNTLSWYSGLLGTNASPFRTGSSSASQSLNPWTTAAGMGLMGTGIANNMGLLGAGAGAGTAASAAEMATFGTMGSEGAADAFLAAAPEVAAAA